MKCMQMKIAVAILAVLAGATVTMADVVSVPTIQNVVMSQDSGRKVTVTYDLVNGPAVVTMDVQTNAHDDVWVSIGEENIYGATTRAQPRGDVSRIVSGDSGTITWRPDLSWPGNAVDNNGARVVLTAWPVDDTPDYLVVDMNANVAAADRVRYYASTNALPGGLFGNPAYRTSHLVFRKIVAKDIEWTMGSICELGRESDLSEPVHRAMLTNNYYLAVFPTTQAQWKMLTSTKNPEFKQEGAMRPMESICYNTVRCCAVGKTDPGEEWPAPPHEKSWLGLLNARVPGMGFDLPGEGEWEFACRAGHGEGYWGTGDPITGETEDPCVPGRYAQNQATKGNTTNLKCGPEDCTPIVGSYAPNSWGIYDQCGGVREMCLDWSGGDNTALAGLVNVTPGTKRIIRGGGWTSAARKTRPAARDDVAPTIENAYMGFRIACRAGLK